MSYNQRDDANDFTNTAMMILGGISASVNKFVFVAPSRCLIRSVKLVSDTATADSSGTAKYTFQVANLTASANLCSTAKTTDGAEMAGDTAYDLGIDQNTTVAANDVLELQITKTGSPTDLSSAQISIAVTYRPTDKYPTY